MEYSKIVEALDRIFSLIERQGISCRGTQETQTQTHTHTHTHTHIYVYIYIYIYTIYTCMCVSISTICESR